MRRADFGLCADVGGLLPLCTTGSRIFNMFSSPRQLCLITSSGKGGDSMYVTWELLFSYTIVLLTLVTCVIGIIALVISIVKNIKK